MKRFRVVRHDFCDYTVECKEDGGYWLYVIGSWCLTFWGATYLAKRLKKNGDGSGKRYWEV